MNWKSNPVPPETLCPQHTLFATGQSNTGVVAELNGLVTDLENVNKKVAQFPQVQLTVTFSSGDYKARNELIARLKKMLDNDYK